MVVLHRFFKLVQEKWNPRYQAKHRLINFEQAMILMAEVFGEESDWIPTYLAGVVDKTLADSDWTFEGIKAYTEYAGRYLKADKFHTAGDIVEWAAGQEDFEKCEMLTNGRRLGRYLQTHKSLVASSLGLVDKGQRNNRQVYQIVTTNK